MMLLGKVAAPKEFIEGKKNSTQSLRSKESEKRQSAI